MKAIRWKVGLQRSAANERWLSGLCVIAMKLSTASWCQTTVHAAMSSNGCGKFAGQNNA